MNSSQNAAQRDQGVKRLSTDLNSMAYGINIWWETWLVLLKIIEFTKMLLRFIYLTNEWNFLADIFICSPMVYDLLARNNGKIYCILSHGYIVIYYFDINYFWLFSIFSIVCILSYVWYILHCIYLFGEVLTFSM